jgi:hypothetical protein
MGKTGRMVSVLGVLGLVFLSQPVFAKAKKSSANVDKLDAAQDLQLPVSHGELQAEIAAEQAQRDRANAPKAVFELGFSSWRPNLSAPARIGQLTGFSAGAVPTVSISDISPILGDLSLELGLSLITENRFGTLTAAGLSERLQETAYVGQLRVGTRYSPWQLLEGRLRPFVSVNLLPTMVVSKRSAFDDGISDMGVGAEFGLGAATRIWKQVNFDLKISQEVGKAGDSSLNGFAAGAGLIFPI